MPPTHNILLKKKKYIYKRETKPKPLKSRKKVKRRTNRRKKKMDPKERYSIGQPPLSSLEKRR